MRAYDVHLVQLFQNLIGNALKYRSEAPPVIEIRASADAENGRWLFSFATTASVLLPASMSRCSGFSNACIPRRNIQEQALDWRSARSWWSAMAGGSGSNRKRAAELPSSSLCRHETHPQSARNSRIGRSPCGSIQSTDDGACGALAESALTIVDEVVLAIPRSFPHKQFEGATLEQRLAMLQRIAEGTSGFLSRRGGRRAVCGDRARSSCALSRG